MKFNLSELVKIVNGYAFKSADIVSDQSVYVIKIKNIQSSKILLEKDSMTAEVDGLNKYQIKFNDILISLTGSGMNQMSSAVGKVGRFRHTQKAYLNQRVAKISSLDETKLTNDYLYYFINRPEIQKDLVSVATGSANQVNISPKIIGELSIDLPDLAEQERITNMLTALDSKIEILESINDNLLELAQQIFVGKYLSKQDSFPMTTLSEIVGVKTDTFNPKKSNDNEVAHFSLPAFDSGSVPTVDLVDSIKSNKNIITQYTVLASKMNPTTKRVWIPNYVQGMTNVASTEFLTFNASDEYQQAFIWAVVDSEGYQNHLISGATGSTGSRQRIKPGDAYSFEVGYNPDEAHRIGMILNPLLQQVKNNRDEIVTLVQLRNNLLTNLLN